MKRVSDVAHNLALRSKGHGGIVPRATLAVFPIPRSSPERLKRRSSMMENIGELLPFWKSLSGDVNDHPWRSVIMIAAEWTFCGALSSYVSFSHMDAEMSDVVRSILVLSFGIRLLVPLASSSRLLAEEIFTHLPADDSIRMSMGALGGVLEGLVWLLGTAIIGSALGFDMSSAVAGLGLGGVALAFSMQKSLEALASTVEILLDRPFVAGERIVLQSGDCGIVEKIGFRTSHIRSLGEGELLIVPNVELANTRIKNRSRCDYRRLALTLEVDCATAPDDLARVEDVLVQAAMAAPHRYRVDGAGLVGLGCGRWGGHVFEVVFFVVGGSVGATLRSFELTM